VVCHFMGRLKKEGERGGRSKKGTGESPKRFEVKIAHPTKESSRERYWRIKG